jgi:hypothetical protein
MSESILWKRNSIEKQVAKPSEIDGFATIRNWWFCSPKKTYQSLVEKLFSPINFDEKIMGRNKIENLPVILEAKLSLYVSIYHESLHKKYPPKSLFNDDGTSPEHIFWPRPWCTPQSDPMGTDKQMDRQTNKQTNG